MPLHFTPKNLATTFLPSTAASTATSWSLLLLVQDMLALCCTQWGCGIPLPDVILCFLFASDQRHHHGQCRSAAPHCCSHNQCASTPVMMQNFNLTLDMLQWCGHLCMFAGTGLDNSSHSMLQCRSVCQHHVTFHQCCQSPCQEGVRAQHSTGVTMNNSDASGAETLKQLKTEGFEDARVFA